MNEQDAWFYCARVFGDGGVFELPLSAPATNEADSSRLRFTEG